MGTGKKFLAGTGRFVSGVLGTPLKLGLSAIALGLALYHGGQYVLRDKIPDDPDKSTTTEITEAGVDVFGDATKVIVGDNKEEFGDRIENGLNTIADYGGEFLERAGKVLQERTSGVGTTFNDTSTPSISSERCTPSSEPPENGPCEDGSGNPYYYDLDETEFCAEDPATGAKHCVGAGQSVPRQP